METIVETNQFLTFTLKAEKYAIDVARVREVLELVPISKVPKTPAYMKGVINLRGSVVPVIDLRLKFDMEEAEPTVDTCIIVLEVHLSGEEVIVLGAVSDSVEEVIELPPEKIEPTPRIGTRLDTDFIQGMGKYNEEFLILLDIDKVFTASDIVSLANTVKSE